MNYLQNVKAPARPIGGAQHGATLPMGKAYNNMEDKFSPANYEAFQLIGSSDTNTISWRLPFSFRGRNARITVVSVSAHGVGESPGDPNGAPVIMRAVEGFRGNDLRTFQNDGATPASNDILTLGLYVLATDGILETPFTVEGKLEGENLTIQMVNADAPGTGATLVENTKIYCHMLVEYCREEHFRSPL
jgi:hypothetical protein